MSSSTNIWEISTNNNGNGTDNNQFYISDTSDPVKKLTIQRGTGIVGVGTNTPISIADENVKLDVNGSLNLSGNIYKNGVLYVSNSTTWIENGEKIYYSSGNVGINTTNPLELLEVNGTIKATNIIADGSGVTFLNASSISTGKLNNNILPATISTGYFKGSGAGITNINPAAFSFGSINNIHMPDNITGKTYIGVGSNITNLNASNIYIGTLHNDRMPANISVSTLAGNGSGITNLNPLAFSGNITNSQLPADISVTTFTGIGSGITNLNATYITSGKLNTAQLPDTISGKTFSGDGFNITNLNANNISSSSGVLSNSIIPDNLSISGTFTAANLLVNGTSTIIDTITYQTSKLNITNTYNADPSLIIEHNSQYNVININDNNTRRVTISNGGNVGIGGTAFPNTIYKLDVDGGINSSGNISSQKVLIRDTLEFYKDSTNSVLIKLPQTISNYTITLPNAGPAANNILKSDSSGNLSWVNINESPTLENVYAFFDNTDFEKTTNITLKNIKSSKLIPAFNSTQFELFGDPQIIRIKDNLITLGNVSLTSINDPPGADVTTLNIVDTRLTDSTEPAATPSVPKQIPTDKYQYHTLTFEGTSGYTSTTDGNQRTYNINFSENVVADILVVGGGGGGGKRGGGGGGAGALLYHKNVSLNGAYTIKVGNGGAGNNGGQDGGTSGFSGKDSEIINSSSTILYRAKGGGGGQGGSLNTDTSGGSAGGGTWSGGSDGLSTNNIFNGSIVSVSNNQYVNSLQSPEGCRGNIGGTQTENYKGGGGGGAGGAGQNHGVETTTNDGYGGIGLTIDITGTPVVYAGGGNGGNYSAGIGTEAGVQSQSFNPLYPTIESRGGGGYGSDNGNAQNGLNGTGGGGGGQGTDGNFSSGNGGSGIVIIRYYVVSSITHKYLAFTPPPNLVYDFTPYNDFTSWTNYATQIGATWDLELWYSTIGVFKGGLGYIQLQLPSNYDTIQINYANPHTGGNTSIYIDTLTNLPTSTYKDRATAYQSRIYTTTYTTGQYLKITEDEGVIGGDLIITFSKSQTTYSVNFPVNTTCDILTINNTQYIKTSGVILNGSYSVVVGSTSKIQQNSTDLYVPNTNLNITDSITGSSATYTSYNPIVIIRYSMTSIISDVMTTQNVVPAGYLKFDGSDWFIDEINSNDYLSRNSLYNELSISRYLSNNNFSIIITYQYSVDNIVWYDIDKGDDIYIAKSGYAGTYPVYKNNFVGNTLFIKVKSCSLNNIYNNILNISSVSPYTSHTHTITYSISSVSITPTPSISYTGNELTFSINLNTINFQVNTKKILTINLSTNYDALTGGTGSTRQQTDKFYLSYEQF